MGPGAYLRRQQSRPGAPKAITATAHKLARIVYHLGRFGEAYMKRTEAEYAGQVRERQEKQLRRRARELGFDVVPRPEAGPGGRATPPEAAGGRTPRETTLPTTGRHRDRRHLRVQGRLEMM